MHEVAHILRKHPRAKIVQLGDVVFRTYDPAYEKEAEWLGACLQITREGLVWAVKSGMSPEQIAGHFGASQALVRFRRNTTGVDVQLQRARSAWRRG